MRKSTVDIFLGIYEEFNLRYPDFLCMPALKLPIVYHTPSSVLVDINIK